MIPTSLRSLSGDGNTYYTGWRVTLIERGQNPIVQIANEISAWEFAPIEGATVQIQYPRGKCRATTMQPSVLNETKVYL
jgi:hypothetical protein